MSEQHESSGIDVRVVLGSGAALIGVVIAVVAVVYWFYPPASSWFEPAASQWTQRVQNAPRLQQSPQQDLEQLREAQLQRLQSYGWVDRQRGIAHIPIAEAMRRLPQIQSEVVIEPPRETDRE